ncbi:MAG TPA: 5'-3' exonuclease H3TH domain-containing protein [Candidatus Atribacteria bacterium]|nr:5'-3' exonuclease H3TH domain-containing protein [Candidatus Atribacteria bacterium]
MEDKKLVVIDGSSLIYRAFYALPRLTTSSGLPTGATLGFLNMVLKLLDDYRPFNVVVAFDHPQKTFRHELQESYKAQRKPMPDELKPQIGIVKELLELMGFVILEMPGWEGDDLMGSVKEKVKSDFQVLLVTSDLDMLQLLDERTVLLQPHRGVTSLKKIDLEEFQKEWGISPAQWVDVLALSGDPSDNIFGVPGIGEKTAVKLILQFGSWEGILNHLSLLPPKLREAIESNRDKVEENRKLIVLEKDLPLDLEIQAWGWSKVDKNKLFQKLESLEFRKIKERLVKNNRVNSGSLFSHWDEEKE